MRPVTAAAGALAHTVALVSVEMGYGHLRAAQPIAEVIGCRVLELDRPPLASPDETRRWQRVRAGYELISRASQLPLLGPAFGALIEGLTEVPSLYGPRRHSQPTMAVAALERMASRGLGTTLVDYLKRENATLVTTFYAPAILAELGGLERIVCVVTDADFNRVWVPWDPRSTKIHYCAPSERVRRRLLTLGVRAERVHLTGFPLPLALTGGGDLASLRRNLASRLVRLDPAGTFRSSHGEELQHFLGTPPAGGATGPPLLTFAVGGAGAQLSLASAFLPSLAPSLARGSLSLALVAGTRPEVADALHALVTSAGLTSRLGNGVEILSAPDFTSYYGRFCTLLERTDVLWTKPSEMTFYGALGLPLVFSSPIGAHERYNRRWARERGAGLKQHDPRHAGQWLQEWLEDGVLAAAAWSGYLRLPKFGTQRIVEVVEQVSRG